MRAFVCPALRCAGLVFLLALSVPASAAEDFLSALQNGPGDARPLLVLVRNPSQLSTLDAAYWLDDVRPDGAYEKALGWVDRLEGGGFAELRSGGLFLLDARRALVAQIPIPPLRAQLKVAIQEALVDLTPLAVLTERAEAGVAGDEMTRRAWQRLVDAGQSERAARLLGKPENAVLARRLAEVSDLPLREALCVMRSALQAGDSGGEERARGAMRNLLEQRLGTVPRLRSLELLSSAVSRWGSEDDDKALRKIIERESPVGRAAAMAALRLGDVRFAGGDASAADDWWKLAERAAENGESPVLYRAILRRRLAADGKDLPSRSRWYKRDVLDVVVLVDDLPSYAEAVSRWTEKTFFPVLFRDRVFAPRFLHAFRPSRVVMLPPSNANATLLETELRRALLSSWLKPEEEGRLPASVGRNELLDRLRSFGDDPQGVVFTHEDSAEVAGALALAAGRFQGLEFLETGMHAQQATLTPMGVRALAQFVEKGLERWGLPREGRSCAVTLGGGFPLRYEVSVGGRTELLAVDDWIGRSSDGGRLAFTGRLLGGREASAFAAACALFLESDGTSSSRASLPAPVDPAASSDLDALRERMGQTGAFWFAAVTRPDVAVAWRPERERREWAKGFASWGLTFRRDDGQAFSWPGSGMILGDPLFSLRKSPAKRRALEGGRLVRSDEQRLRVDGKADFVSEAWLEKMGGR